jgi:hypothetical protein
MPIQVFTAIAFATVRGYACILGADIRPKITVQVIFLELAGPREQIV